MIGKNIYEASELPEGDKVYLKKDRFGWRIIEPVVDENGKIIWKNMLFGGYRNLMWLIIIIITILVIAYSYNNDIEAYREVYENPCVYCSLKAKEVFSPEVDNLRLSKGLNLTDNFNNISELYKELFPGELNES